MMTININDLMANYRFNEMQKYNTKLDHQPLDLYFIDGERSS